MDNNVGVADRVVRIVAGVLLLSVPLFAPDASYSFLGWLGIVPILTAIVGFCPVYTILGLRTNPKRVGHG